MGSTRISWDWGYAAFEVVHRSSTAQTDAESTCSSSGDIILMLGYRLVVRVAQTGFSEIWATSQAPWVVPNSEFELLELRKHVSRESR